MSIMLDNVIIDRILHGVATKFDGTPLYVLTQLSEATINITANSEDQNDAMGNLIRRSYRNKAGEFTATNAMLNLSIVGAMSGEDIVRASSTKKIMAPKTVVIPGNTTTVNLPNIATSMLDALSVAGQNNSGTMTAAYTKAAAAGTQSFAIASDGTLTLPTPTIAEDKYFIKYYREIENGGMIRNRVDKFPGTVSLLLACLAVDPCSADTLRKLYVEFPSFQPSPETEIALQIGGTIQYSGSLQTAYCDSERVLYTMYWDDEEEYEED